MNLNELNVFIAKFMFYFAMFLLLVGAVLFYFEPCQTYAAKMLLCGNAALWYALIADVIFKGGIL